MTCRGTSVVVQRITRVGVAAALLVALAAPAAADERYAEQIIAADMVALTLAVGGHETDHDATRGVGLGVGVSAAPLIHVAQGNYRGAVSSLGLRVALPLATAWLTNKITPDRVCFTPMGSHDFCGGEDRIGSATMVGLTVGLVAASVLDASLVAKKPARTGREWRPVVTFKNQSVGIDVAARF
jgi:hypothetical protein